jgi:hypothetical protein
LKRVSDWAFKDKEISNKARVNIIEVRIYIQLPIFVKDNKKEVFRDFSSCQSEGLF